MLKFGEERMKITLILFVYVILSSKWSLKKPIFDQKGGRNLKFQKIQKVPLDILEIHVVSEFGPIPMKIAACRCCDRRTNERTNKQTNE